MEDKSPLELDIEEQERYRAPLSTYILILILAVGLIGTFLYVFELRQDLLLKEQKIALLQEKLQREKVELVGQIKRLEAENESLLSEKEKKFPDFRRKALEKK